MKWSLILCDKIIKSESGDEIIIVKNYNSTLILI